MRPLQPATRNFVILFFVFSLKDNPWLRFFRLPNLPTAPGDALAGAAFMMPEGDATLVHALAAGVGALFMYMYGLADNDLVGARTDAVDAPERPIPRGEISMTAASLAGCFCLFAAYVLPSVLVGVVKRGESMPLQWSFAMFALWGSICAYNRLKKAWLMGVCRGLSVICGGMAVWVPDLNPYTQRMLPEHWCLLASLALLALGWVAYIAAVTKLSEGEGRTSEGLGRSRYLLGLSAFVPFLGFVPVTCSSWVAFDSVITFALPLTGCCCTFVAWCLAVAPLWRPHGPSERRRAVGRTISALFYLQVGFMLVVPRSAFIAAAAILWLAIWLVHHMAPDISGS